MRATQDDLARVVDMGVSFHAASPHNLDPVDLPEWTAFASRLIDNGGVFVSDGGMVGGALCPMYFNPSVVYAYELFWWAPDGSGRSLMNEFREWAKSSGARGIQWTALHDDNLSRVDRIYQRAGAVPTEVAYREVF
jgi:hypothetical protein